MQHSGSGNGDFRKNDMAQIEGLPHERMHIECKRTDGKRQITIKATDLTDLLLNATRAGGKVPALYFELDGEDWLVMQPGDVVDRV
jgi:Holliday junction resolvase